MNGSEVGMDDKRSLIIKSYGLGVFRVPSHKMVIFENFSNIKKNFIEPICLLSIKLQELQNHKYFTFARIQ